MSRQTKVIAVERKARTGDGGTSSSVAYGDLAIIMGYLSRLLVKFRGNLFICSSSTDLSPSYHSLSLELFSARPDPRRPQLRAGVSKDITDHLSRLPIEIWCEIFIFEAPFIMTPELFSNGFDNDGWNITSERMRKLQHRRRELLTICKSLYPLLERLLFTEITLDYALERERVEFFLIRANCGVKPGILASEYIKSALVSYDLTIRILDLCPNLVHLYAMPIWVKMSTFTRPRLPFYGTYNLEMLRVDEEGLNWEELAQLSPLIPNLTRLRLKHSWNVQDPNLVLEFPHLRSLRLDLPFRNSTGLFPRFQSPSLRYLGLTIPETVPILSAVRQCPSSIVDLELRCELYRQDTGQPTSPEDIFILLPSVKKLTLDLNTIGRRMSLPLVATWIPNKQLQALTLHGRLLDIKTNTEEKLSYFSRDRFINLSYVNVYIYSSSRYGIERVPPIFKRAFTGIDSAVYIHGDWTNGWKRIDNAHVQAE